MRISRKFLDRAKTSLKKYQRILESARARDVNESDTVVIISDLLADLLGYDKYHEITTEFAIRSTFCDLAVKIDGRVMYLIEVKSAGTDLKENHLRQAVDYAANQGIEWVLLTNGIVWQAHRLRFEQPIQNDEVFTIDLLDESAKPAALLEKLYLISREGIAQSEMSKYWQRKEATSRYVLAQLILAPASLGLLRRALRRQFAGLKVSMDDIAGMLSVDVLKRDAIEGERAVAAARLVKRGVRKKTEKAKQTAPTDAAIVETKHAG